MNRFKRLFLAASAFFVCVPLLASAQTNILFVGNSFTFVPAAYSYNNANVTDLNGSGMGGVPGIFKKMATDLNYPCNVFIEAVGGQNFAYHLANESQYIGQSRWNTVVLQDYSTEPTNTSPPGNVSLYLSSLGQMQTLILGANPNAKIYLYETWARPGLCVLPGGPGNTYISMADMLSQLHTNYYLGNSTYNLNGVAPVGDAFALAVSSGYAEANPYQPTAGEFDLWDTDYYHESVYGAYLAGAVFIAKLTGLDPRTIPTGTGSAAAGLGISSTDAAHLNIVAYNSVNIPPVITSPNATTFATGILGNFTVTATGIPTPTFSATGLPSWASLNPTTGVISGTPSNTSGSPFNVTITATNGVSPDSVQNFTLNVQTAAAPAFTNGPPTTPVMVNTAYNFTYSVTGVPTPTFSLTTGSLPSGITLSPTGTLSGTPTQTGTYTGTVTLNNGIGSLATQNFSIVVQQTPTFTSGPSPTAATVGTSYIFKYATTGYPAPTFTVISGSLPPGIILSTAGAFSGKPTTTGTYSGTVRAQNGIGSAVTQNFSITVQSSTGPAVVAINCGATSAYTASDGTVYIADTYSSGGLDYTDSATIQNTSDPTLYHTYYYGSGTPFSYAIPLTNGTYIVTLKFCETNTSDSTGTRIGTYALEGTSVLTNFDIYAVAGGYNIPLDESFLVTVSGSVLNLNVTNIAGNPRLDAIRIRAAQVAPAISNGPATSSGTVGTAYSFTYSTSGAPTPTVTRVSGMLPPGITLSSAGALAGTPTLAGIYSGTVSASNGVGSNATQNFTIAISGTYAQWAGYYGAGGIAATPQNDGVSNLLKYFCDIKPNGTMTTTDKSALPTAGATNNGGNEYLTLTYRQNASATGVSSHLQTSTDLVNWTTVTPDLMQSMGTDAGTGDPIVLVGVKMTGTKEFIRLSVTMP